MTSFRAASQSLRSSYNRWTDADVQDFTAVLACENQLAAKKEKLASLKDQIVIWEKKLAEQGIVGTTLHNPLNSDHKKSLKNTRKLQNRLFKVEDCLNKLMNGSGELKEELKTLHAERKQFSYVKSLAEKELRTISQNISVLRTKSIGVNNASENIQEQLRTLKKENAKDVAIYTTCITDKEQQLSYYCYTGSFLTIKDTKCINQGSNNKKVKKVRQSKSKEWDQEDFNSAITEILSITGEDDLDTVLEKFIQVERQNDTLLNFINWQHNKAEAIRGQISKLCSELEMFMLEEQHQKEHHQAFFLKASIDKDTTERQLAVYQHHVQSIEKLLQQLKEGVKSLFRLGYSSSVISSKQVSSDGIECENITHYLLLVEDRVKKLLTLLSCIHSQKILSHWDTEGLCEVAIQVLGISPQMFKLNSATKQPPPCLDRDLLESVMLEKEKFLTLVNKKVQSSNQID